MTPEQIAQMQAMQVQAMQAQAAQAQALAQGQPQSPVDVAGSGCCGVSYPTGGLGGGYLGGPCGPSGHPLPYIPPPNLIGPNALYQSAIIPLGFRARFDEDGNVISTSGSTIGTAIGTAIEISVGNNSQFHPCGIRIFTGAGLIQLDQIAGGGGFNVLPGAVDAAVYNTDDCFCPIDLPCISPFSPLTISARALEIPEDTTTTAVQDLSGALFGYWIRNLTGCSPINTLPPLGSGPMMLPSAYPAGPCPPTADMGGVSYGMPTPQ